MPLVAANWKMHGDRRSLDEWLRAVADGGLSDAVEAALLPPFTLLPALQSAAPSNLSLGAQSVGEAARGAFTGEVSASMLLECGCRYALVGHSERRAMGETDADAAKRLRAAADAGLTPILCVGETLEQREAGEAERAVAGQLQAADGLGSLIVAYEPVWAIGGGGSAAPEQIAHMHERARALCADIGVDAARVLYGGSVNPDNVADIAALPEVDGALVGGASLRAASFLAICAAFA